MNGISKRFQVGSPQDFLIHTLLADLFYQYGEKLI